MLSEKPQETVIRETKRISAGTAAMTAVMLVIYAILGRFSLSVLLGAAVGAVTACADFFRLGMTAQRALATGSADQARAQMKASYNARLILKLLIGAAVYAIPYTDLISYIIPLLFPRLTILLLQVTGQIKDEK